MNNTVNSKNSTKYKSARITLILLVALSLLNLLTIFVAQRYFVFSAYFTQLIGVSGYLLFVKFGENAYIISAIIIGVISVVPYVLCWIFSKKHYGWMIASLVIFGIDCAVFLFDGLSIGDLSMIFDCIIRVIVIVELSMAVACGKAYFAELNASKIVPTARPVYDDSGNIVAFVANEETETARVIDENQSQTVDGDENQVQVSKVQAQRKLTLARKKSFVGCAVAAKIAVNGQQIAQVKNGQSITMEVPNAEFSLSAELGLASGGVTVEAGESDLTYEISVKMGFAVNEVIIKKSE